MHNAIHRCRVIALGFVVLFPVTAFSADWDLRCGATYDKHFLQFDLKLENGEVVAFEYIGMDSTGHDCNLTAYKSPAPRHRSLISNWSTEDGKVRVDTLMRDINDHLVSSGSVEMMHDVSSYTLHVRDLSASCAPTGDPWLAPTVVLHVGDKRCQLIGDDGKTLADDKK